MTATNDREMHDGLRDSARAFFTGEGGTKRVRAARETEIGFDRNAWRRMGDLGWLGALLPESLGGSGLGFAEMAILGEELGRAAAAEPLAAVGVLAARAIALGDNASFQSDHLPALTRGELVPVVAWQENVGDIDASVVEAQAQPQGASVTLSGVKRFVAHGLAADGFIVSARAPSGVGLYWVRKEASGVAYEPQRRADGSESGTLTLRDALVASGDVIAPPGRGDTVLAQALDEALVIVSAELAGAAARALEITLDYLRARVQFGKAIGSFQALQHRCVDLYIQKELCVSALGVAVRTLDATSSDAQRAVVASRVKSRCSDAAVEIARKCIQLHGAIGFTDECDIGLYLKRALVQAAWLGNGSTHRRRYAALTLHA